MQLRIAKMVYQKHNFEQAFRQIYRFPILLNSKYNYDGIKPKQLNLLHGTLYI